MTLALENVTLWIESGPVAVAVGHPDLPIQTTRQVHKVCPFPDIRREIYRGNFARALTAALRAEASPSLDQ